MITEMKLMQCKGRFALALVLATLLVLGMIALLAAAPIPSANAASTTSSTPTVNYRVHVQKQGWQGWKKNGTTAGTSGKCLRLEGIYAKLSKKAIDAIQGWWTTLGRAWRDDGGSGNPSYTWHINGRNAVRYDSNGKKMATATIKVSNVIRRSIDGYDGWHFVDIRMFKPDNAAWFNSASEAPNGEGYYLPPSTHTNYQKAKARPSYIR